MKYAYYPGCSLHTGAREYDLSWRAVSAALGIELAEMADWNCCGTIHATNVGRSLALGLAGRNLAIAEKQALDIVAPCSGCYKNLRTANESLQTNAALRAEINEVLSQPVEGAIQVKHPLYIITEDIGLEALSQYAGALAGLKVAPYYGCVITRPAGQQPVDDPENPQALDHLLRALGADVVDYYPWKTKCCGGGVLLSHTEVALDLTGVLLSEAKQAGAQCLAVACPMCQMVLDTYQYKIEKRMKQRFDLPILYFTQLMGIALGIDRRQLGLERLAVSPSRMLATV